ncbi:AmpG family muropeptide MFS transporter [Aeromonas sp. BIGb0445]|uniref:AmpG family muropeptide MFS transporter n=1 Tax=Aeromonas sp. BIGb0445 TaxID=2940593 RepID=UPI002168E080|nr:MFS transporter [Aeromonas sp. BIGb0445]MCS3458080.1 PAT family beta-lactamase induction signal transducer AmpG [Aeromonas sp. BIGb0445]
MNAVSKPSWKESLRVYLEPRVLILFAMGFSSGLPLLLVFGTLSFWLREAGVSLTDIGYMSWVALAYGVKWLWSPLVDRLALPLLSRLLGRRRSWMLFSQLLIAAALVGMSFCDPKTQLAQLALFALLVAFASATQDIVIDAYRIESAPERLQAAMAASYMTGYRLAMIMAGAGALALAAWLGSNSVYDYRGWQLTYLLMAGMMSIGLITTLCCHEPDIDVASQDRQQAMRKSLLLQHGWPRSLAGLGAWAYEAVWCPFADFFERHGRSALLILGLIACYRISDVVMGVMSNSFYVDLAFSKTEVATITKVYGVIMTLVGASVGGILVMRFGTLRILMLGALLTASTNLLFALLNQIGHNLELLTLIISLDNLSAGIATAAFITYLSSLTNVAFSATQYALFSSVMLLLPKLLAGFSGGFVEQFGYSVFFIGTSLLGIPVLILITMVARRNCALLPKSNE